MLLPIERTAPNWMKYQSYPQTIVRELDGEAGKAFVFLAAPREAEPLLRHTAATLRQRSDLVRLSASTNGSLAVCLAQAQEIPEEARRDRGRSAAGAVSLRVGTAPASATARDARRLAGPGDGRVA